MLDATLNRVNAWALERLGRNWVDYLASNTMTELNRRLNAFIWTYELQALITHIHDEAPGVKTLTLLPNQHWQGMRAGQHIEVKAEVNGQAVSRYYSPSAQKRGRFTITVKRKPDGVLSNWLHEHAKVGMRLRIGQPQGDFVDQGQSKLLFICAGSGITPCHAMVQERLAQSTLPLAQQSEHPVRRTDIALYAQFSKVEDTLFAPALRSWKNQMDVRVAYSQEAHQPGQLLHALPLRQQYPDLDERDVYLCGPQGFMDRVMAQLQHEGYDMRRLHAERFVAHQACGEPAASFDVAGAMVHFAHLNQRIALTPADQGKTLIEIAEQHGVHLEVGCRQGMCGTCKLTLHAGQVRGNVLGRAVYLCTSYPASQEVVLGG